MKIQILGTRGKVEPSKPYHSRHTGYLINGELLVDVGEKEFIFDHDPSAILFTHLHPDHAYFVETNERFDPQIPVYAPENSDLIPEVQVVKDSFLLLDYKIEPIPVIHSLKVESLAYMITKGSQSVFISGDVAWIENKYHDQIEGVDMIITEASFIKKGGQIRRKDDKIYGHTGVPDLIRIFQPLTDKIVFTHYGSWFIKDVEAGRQKIKEHETKQAELVPAYDGMTITI